MEYCSSCTHHFANPAKNRNAATVWPELDLGRIKMTGFWPEPTSHTALVASCTVKLVNPKNMGYQLELVPIQNMGHVDKFQ
jgi:hypothetical protein